MPKPVIHGSIMGGIVVTPDLDLALEDYQGKLGLDLVESGPIDPALATAWGTPAAAGARMATLRPKSGTECSIRLVEAPLPADFRPTRTFGWGAYEITVQDVMGWPDRLAGSGFDIVGPPVPIPELPFFVALQMLGRGQEMIYLNEVAMDTPTSDLPKAHSPTDHIFIAILATPDREKSIAWYRDMLKLDEGGSYTIPYTMISKAFGIPLDTLSTITMIQNGRLPIVEVDDYPEEATARGCIEGHLPPANALITLAVEDLDDLAVDYIAPPAMLPGAFYAGRRSATALGYAGELVELLEIGRS